MRFATILQVYSLFDKINLDSGWNWEEGMFDGIKYIRKKKIEKLKGLN